MSEGKGKAKTRRKEFPRESSRASQKPRAKKSQARGTVGQTGYERTFLLLRTQLYIPVPGTWYTTSYYY